MAHKNPKEFLITTLIGGAVFLIPFVIALLVIEKAIGVMRFIAQPLARWIAVDTYTGIALANFIALVSVIVICFLAGMFARGAWVRKTFASWESTLLMKIPGYALIKGVKDVFDPDANGNIRAAMFQLGDVQRIGYEIERISDNRSVVFLPDSPTMFSGVTQIISSDKVTYLEASIGDVIDHSQSYGIGTEKLLDKLKQDSD